MEPMGKRAINHDTHSLTQKLSMYKYAHVITYRSDFAMELTHIQLKVNILSCYFAFIVAYFAVATIR